MMRFILGSSLVALLLLVSQSHPTAADHVSVPWRRAVEEHTSFQPRKLGVYIRKGVGAARGARIPRVAGVGRSSSSSAVPTHLSSFNFASICGCSLFFVMFLL
ncbi:hypothetical protein GQ457_11G022900 [Hibiscus cannabinus]